MKRILVLLTAALLSAAMPAVADAQGRGKGKGPDGRGPPGQERGYGQEREIPLPQLIRMVEQRTGGSYVNANPRMVGGRKYYWMRLRFPGGEFQDFMVDASTGQF